MSELELALEKRKGKRRYSFLDASLRLNGINDILEICLSPIRFEAMRLQSRIKYKGSFLKYLRYCVAQGLVYKSTDPNPIYSTSPKGRQFMELSM